MLFKESKTGSRAFSQLLAPGGTLASSVTFRLSPEHRALESTPYPSFVSNTEGAQLCGDSAFFTENFGFNVAPVGNPFTKGPLKGLNCF